jgi:outer membrane protein insertion porin family
MTFPDFSEPRHARGARSRAVTWLVLLLPLMLLTNAAVAFDSFTVKDIRVEGVQRTEAGTVFNYLPIKVGDTIDDE